MGLGYKITKVPDFPAVVVKLVLPPRLDVENLMRDIAHDLLPLIEASGGPVYRLNDFSMYDNVPIFSLVVRGLALETRHLPGTNSDPRVIPVFVGQGRDVKLIVEALKQEQYGRWHVPLYPTVEDALAELRRTQAREQAAPSLTLPQTQGV